MISNQKPQKVSILRVHRYFPKHFGNISTNCNVVGSNLSSRVVNGVYNDGPGRSVSLRDTPVLDIANALLTTRNLVVDDVLFSTPCNGQFATSELGLLMSSVGTSSACPHFP